MVRRGGDNDRVEGRVLLPPVITIPLRDVDIAIPQIAQPGCGLLGQFRHDLDAVHINVAQFGQHRCLVAGACADFQHLLPRLQGQQLRHPGDDVRL